MPTFGATAGDIEGEEGARCARHSQTPSSWHSPVNVTSSTRATFELMPRRAVNAGDVISEHTKTVLAPRSNAHLAFPRVQAAAGTRSAQKPTLASRPMEVPSTVPPGNVYSMKVTLTPTSHMTKGPLSL